jgi:hypothetical protein
MNTTLMPERSLDRVEQHLSEIRSRSHRLSVLDRLSLRLGLWLLLRSARTPRRVLTAEDWARHLAAQRARDEYERMSAQAVHVHWYSR